MTALDSEDVRATSGTSIGRIIFLAIFTGLRRGELLVLRWSDIDLKNKTLSINRTLVRITGKGLFTAEPKSAKSRRLVSLSPNGGYSATGYEGPTKRYL